MCLKIMAKYYGGEGNWLLGKKIKTEDVGKKMKKMGKGAKKKEKNGLKTHL